MLDNATLSLWLTDIILLGLAYWVGRIHGQVILREDYVKKLSGLVDEVKLMAKKVERLNEYHLIDQLEKEELHEHYGST